MKKDIQDSQQEMLDRIKNLNNRLIRYLSNQKVLESKILKLRRQLKKFNRKAILMNGKWKE